MPRDRRLRGRELAAPGRALRKRPGRAGYRGRKRGDRASRSRSAAGAELDVPVEDRTSPANSAITAPSARNAPAGCRACGPTPPRHEQHGAGTKAAKKPTKNATTTGMPSPAPRNSASFTSPIPMPLGWMKTTTKGASPAPSAHRILHARVVDRPQDDHQRRGGEDDLVGDQPMLEIGARDHHEHPAEDRGGRGLQREAEREPAGASEQCRARGHEREGARDGHPPEQWLVQRRVRRQAVRERADEQPHQRPDEAGPDVHGEPIPGPGMRSSPARHPGHGVMSRSPGRAVTPPGLHVLRKPHRKAGSGRPRSLERGIPIPRPGGDPRPPREYGRRTADASVGHEGREHE